MDLTTVDRVYKFDNALPDSKDRLLLQMIVTGLSGLVQTYLGREIQFRQRIDTFDVSEFSDNLFKLRAFPIDLTDPIFPAHNATAYDVEIGLAAAIGDAVAEIPNDFYFRNAGVDIPQSDLQINKSTGMISCAPLVLKEGGLGQVEVQYWGGMAQTTEDFIAKFPDLEYGFLLQVLFEYKRKKNLSMVSVGAGGNSAETYIPFKLRDEFIRQLRPYRRAARLC